MAKDYYKILGISKGASQEDVKRAFRELAHKHHPDKANGDAEKFKEINEAYQVLGNPEKRKQYDQFGSAFENMGGGGFGGGQNPFGGFGNGGINMEDLNDIFGDFFGMSRGGRTRTKERTRGADIEMDLTIDFKESIFGAEKVVDLYKNSKCEICNGTGAEPDAKIKICSECGGSGKITKMQNTMFGSFQTATVCPRCHGAGKIPEKYCKECSGTGIRKKSVSLKINIPGGINDSEILRITGAGNAASAGGASGDLYIHINVKNDKKFVREGDNIIMKTPLDFKTAVLGGEIEAETLEGAMRIKIPEGTESGQVFRLRGKGVAHRGDLLVEVYITVPKKLSKKQKKILDEWEE